MRNTDNFEKVRSFSGAKPFIDGFFNSIRITLTSITLLMAMVVSVLSIFVIIHLSKVPNLSILEDYNPGASIELFDRNDQLVCEFPSKEKRKPVPISEVSPYMISAVLAAEDHYYYEHNGISYVGIMRATLANISHGKPVQGGSTLTQQLVKNLFYEKDNRTIPLKIAEGIVASQIESKYSKEKILEIYLNQIYFGNRAYGVEQAARTYFATDASNLTVAQSAFLAGIIKSPSYLGSKKHRQKGLSRQRTVIKKMLEYKFISELEANGAFLEPLVFKSMPRKAKKENQFVPPYPYYSQFVQEAVSSTYNYTHHKRLKVYTTLDIKAQKSAEKIINSAGKRLPKKLDQAALVAMRISDGAVVSMVGGIGNFLDHQWNSAVHPHTMGSSFKPFVYLAAFEQGVISPSSQLYDSPFSVLDEGDNVWNPQNFDHRYLGYMTAEDALAHSRNVCTVRVAQQIGIGRVINAARRAGIKEDLAPTLALSLGSSASSPLSMATAYATVARGGMYIKPLIVRKITDDRGTVLAKFEPTPSRTLDLVACRQTVDILKKVVLSGTGTRARLRGIPMAGKTGTADDGKDLWFVGFTPDLVVAIWVGNSQNKKVGGGHITGGRVVAPIWKRFAKAYYSSHPKPKGELITDGGPSTTSSIRKENEIEPIVTHKITYPQSRKKRTRKKRKRHKMPSKNQGTGITEYNWN